VRGAAIMSGRLKLRFGSERTSISELQNSRNHRERTFTVASAGWRGEVELNVRWQH
jgi:hypothetical protein